MKNPRFTGLMLLLTGVLILMGNTLNALPPEAFWAGLLTYPIGAYLFLMGSRQANERPPRRSPRTRASGAPAEPQPVMDAPGATAAPEERIADSLRQPAQPAEAPAMGEAPPPDRQPLDAVPPESSLEDQLAKLTKLQQQGIISAEEYAVAKAKLTG